MAIASGFGARIGEPSAAREVEDGTSGRRQDGRPPSRCTWYPTAVVVQTPVGEWVRWLDALAEFTKRRDHCGKTLGVVVVSILPAGIRRGQTTFTYCGVRRLDRSSSQKVTSLTTNSCVRSSMRLGEYSVSDNQD
jgi:hypothetical protein